MRLIVQKWAQLTCSSLLSALPPPSSASALLGAPPRSTGTEHCMLESNAMQALQWMSATRFGAIFFLGPVVFLMWRSLYMYMYYWLYPVHNSSSRHICSPVSKASRTCSGAGAACVGAKHSHRHEREPATTHNNAVGLACGISDHVCRMGVRRQAC